MSQFHDQCPFCANPNLKDRFVANGYQVTGCPSCSLQFVRQDVTAEELDHHYATESYDYVYGEEDNVDMLLNYYQRCDEIISSYHDGGQLLDVGCAQGQFLCSLGDKWDRHGVEISSRHAERANQKLDGRVFNGTLDKYDAEPGSFDVITMMDVLDHSRRPIDDLRICYDLLKPGGIVLVKVHNISCLWAKLTGKHFYAVIPPVHLYYFNRDTLSLALDKAGFAMTDAQFIGQTIALKTIPYRLSQENHDSLFYKLHLLLSKTPLGDIKIYKNLHDIITVVGRKPG